MSEVEGYCVCDGASTPALDCGVSAHRAKARELRAGSSVPEAARAAKAESDARLDRWFGAYCEAKALGGSGRAGLYRLMALADAEVAAAVAEERATTGRRIEAKVAELRETWEFHRDPYRNPPHPGSPAGVQHAAAASAFDRCLRGLDELSALVASPSEPIAWCVNYPTVETGCTSHPALRDNSSLWCTFCRSHFTEPVTARAALASPGEGE